MSGFSAGWLALREPYDARARSPAVLDAVIAAFRGRPQVRIVDLGCGTGATVRALAPRLTCSQNWRLIDNDLGLLARAADAMAPAGTTLEAVALDLDRDLEAVLDPPIDLVTASALLDLVSEEWLERMAVETALRGIPVYAALSYDGRVELDPTDALDAEIVAAVNRHQRTDKGFGPALGPGAAPRAIERFRQLGHEVVSAVSDWELGPDDRAIQLEILAGWAGAVREIDAVPRAETAGWLQRRRDAVAAGRSSIRVGHVDVFACPMGMRRADRSQSNSTSSPI